MALEDLQSQYGPYNPRGKKGTGEIFDVLANEGTSGLEDGQSKYASKSKNGTKPTGADAFGNKPAERSYE